MKTAKAILILAGALLLLFYSGSSRADTITLNLGNAAISGYPSPYASVDVSLSDSTHATITFTAADNYTMGDGSTVALNVHAVSFTASSLTETNKFSGFSPNFILFNYGSQTVDGFGTFNFTIDNKDGWGDSATTVTFTLINNSGTWGSDADVLIANAGGFTAASHIFVPYAIPPTVAGGAVATGYATNVAVPEPGTLIFLGIAMSAVGIVSRYVRKI